MSEKSTFYQKHKQLILYFSFGIITTVVSLGICYLTLKLGVLFLHDENGEPTELLDILGSTTQWISGVLVAFITNKKWVFTDADRGTRSTFYQLTKFAGGRVLTYFVEVVVNLATIFAFEALGYKPFDILGIAITARVIAKLASSVIIVITNYFISKLFVFKVRSK